MEESRTKKVTRNTLFSLLYKISDVVLAFVLRTVFIYTLGKTYLGLSGLFSNILTVLSMMELGVGGAIVFSLYKPLAEKDYGKTAALMQLYKNVYRVIGTAVCVIGFALTPFLDKILNLPEGVEHIRVIYWLSIANTAVSYFLAYRRSLIIADQRSDINFKNQILFRCTRFLALSLSLLLFRNYILYLALDVLNTLCSNIQITFLVKKSYPAVERASITPLNQEEKQNILKYIGSGVFTKFGQTIVNSTDNIMISAFISTVLVGMYSNYYMVTSSLDVAVYLLFSGLTASIGNFALQKSKEEAERLFQRITFLNYIISAYFSVCLISLFNAFILLWAGKDYLLSSATVAVIVLNFYLATLQKSIECFMGSRGDLFYRNRFRSLIEGVVNLVVSFVLVQYTSLGITGIFLGTTACFVVGRMWMDAHTLYQHWFQSCFWRYCVRYFLRFAMVLLLSAVGVITSQRIFRWLGNSIFSWCVAAIIVSVMFFGCMWMVFHKREEYLFWRDMVKQKLKK